MNFLVYKATDPEGFIYIGYTGKSLEYRIKTHLKEAINTPCRRFCIALLKYGNKITWEILEKYETKKEALSGEILNIKLHNSMHPLIGHNSTKGGECSNSKGTIRPELYKSVRCLNDGKYFESIKSAAAFYKIGTSYLVKMCKGKKKSAKGIYLCYEEDYDFRLSIFNKIKKIEVKRTQIIDQNGVIYESVTIAAKINKSSTGHIVNAIKNSVSCNGMSYSYYTEGMKSAPVLLSAKKMKVKCLENGKIYESCSEASRELNEKYMHVYNSAVNNKNFGNYTFEKILGGV